ncbi:hypothetical protein [Candidatus Similichlamydia epinepheli]|uniref:hypothetical protein n=1 Tax=Candidatus Similichlamydia epinepheli TaxID=1903953 RepID=UPI0013009B5C|nr:hypothetical protein [Candidatus Similichlamydia epinepheli]
MTDANAIISMAIAEMRTLSASITSADDLDSIKNALHSVHFVLQDLKGSFQHWQHTSLFDLGTAINNDITNILTSISDANIIPSSSLARIQGEFKTALDTLINRLTSFQGNVGALNVNIPVNEALYFNYARTGEALLNQEVTSLGDALLAIKNASQHINDIESVLAINPGKGFFNERGELMITNNAAEGATASDISSISNGSSNYFYNLSEFRSIPALVAGVARDDAITVLKHTAIKLQSSLNLLPENSDHYRAINNVIDLLVNQFNIMSWDRGVESDWADRRGGNSTEGELYWATFDSIASSPKNFARLYMNQEVRKAVSDAISTLHSQNDVQKQMLSKALFLYQEFIKSSASLLDMTFKCEKSVAQKIAR